MEYQSLFNVKKIKIKIVHISPVVFLGRIQGNSGLEQQEDEYIFTDL